MYASQCDNCRKLGPVPPVGWLAVADIKPPRMPSFLSVLQDQSEEQPPMFCGWRCLADYAIAKALIPREADGV